jgi:serine/threonine protein kinase
MQGAQEFKNEIELLSRVHHKNLVGLIGFCYEQGEQMLVYEYISNGTLRDNLVGMSLINVSPHLQHLTFQFHLWIVFMENQVFI